MSESMDVKIELTSEMVCDMCHEHYNQGIIDAVKMIKGHIEDNHNLEEISSYFETMILDAEEAASKAKSRVDMMTTEQMRRQKSLA